MSRIWFTSDLHFGHNREFIYGPRGFQTVWDMDRTIVENWNRMVEPEDDVYVLGDLMLGDSEYGRGMITQLKGNIHIILGNIITAISCSVQTVIVILSVTVLVNAVPFCCIILKPTLLCYITITFYMGLICFNVVLLIIFI